MMNLRTAGMNCFSVRVSVASSHRNLQTIWDNTQQTAIKIKSRFIAPSRGHMQLLQKTFYHKRA